MQKLSEVKKNYETQLEKYQMYYVDSVIGDDKSLMKSMKKQAEECIPLLKYYAGQLDNTKSFIRWLEQSVKTLQESVQRMNNEVNDKEKIKTTYGSLRFYEDCYNKELGQLTALQNLLSYLKS